MTKVAVILSGCGVYDGSEIYESTITLLALDRAGVEYQCMAPNMDQMHVINHLTGSKMNQSRNVLVEAARLARGNILELGEAKHEKYDALIVPGGFGAAKNLSDFAVKGASMKVNEKMLTFAQAIHNARKPIGLICITPALAPKIFGEGVECTIGSDEDTANAINVMGGSHQQCAVDDIVVDEKRRLVTTPAYMLGTRISEVATGIEKLVAQVLKMTK